MLNQLTIQLKAINPNRNISRQYEIYVGKDLFGSWLLMTVYGRIGKGGHVKQYAFRSQQSLMDKLLEILKKRLSSQSRIGANYQVTALLLQDDVFLSEAVRSLLDRQA